MVPGLENHMGQLKGSGEEGIWGDNTVFLVRCVQRSQTFFNVFIFIFFFKMLVLVLFASTFIILVE